MIRRLLPLSLVFLAAGLAIAIVNPFLALFLSTEVDAGAVQVTVFLVATPAAGVITSHALARLSDRYAIRRLILITGSVTGFAGSLATAFVRDYWILLLVSVTASALAGTLFPQTFAYARQVLQHGDPERAALAISGLRTVFSIAWVAGPALAALLLEVGGFRLVYGVAAITYAVAGLIAATVLREPPPIPPETAGPVTGRPGLLIMLTVTAFVLLKVPLALSLQALPLFLAEDLGSDSSYAGLLLGLCAALEIPLMIGLGMLAVRVPLRLMILIGSLCGVAYFGLSAVATSIWVLVAGQLLNALFISAINGLGISYMQELMPREPGRASTLFTNTFPIAAMLAGPMLGLAQQFGYRLAFALCTAFAALGVVLFRVARPLP